MSSNIKMQLDLWKPEDNASKVFTSKEYLGADKDGNEVVKAVATQMLKKRDIAQALGLDMKKDKDELDERILAATDSLKDKAALIAIDATRRLDLTGAGIRVAANGGITIRLKPVKRPAGPSDETIAKSWSRVSGHTITAQDVAAMRVEQLKKLHGDKSVDRPLDMPAGESNNSPMTDEELEAATAPENS